MSISIRLDDKTEAVLRKHLREQRVTLSAFVREAIQEKLELTDKAQSPFELGNALFGRYGSGKSDRSARRKEIVATRIDAKRHSR